MSRDHPLLRIPVGVVIERRKAHSPWVDFVWRPVGILAGIPDAAPWTPLDGDTENTHFYAGWASVELYRSETSGYRDNLATDAALLWVVLRSTGLDPPYEIIVVTADPGVGEAFTESPANLVESVPMPDPVRAAIVAFVAEHHVERPFVKREREPANPDAMARRVSWKSRRDRN